MCDVFQVTICIFYFPLYYVFFDFVYVQGLSLSGGEKEEFKKKMENVMKEKYPNCSLSYYICTDTFGSIATASDSGMLKNMSIVGFIQR